VEKSKVNSVDRRFISNAIEELEYRVDKTTNERISLSKSLADAMIAGLRRIG